MRNSYIQEFAKIASVDDVYDIYEMALLQKEANDMVGSPSATQRFLAASKEMHPSAGAQKMMPAFKPLPSLKGTPGSRIGKALGGLMGRVR